MLNDYIKDFLGKLFIAVLCFAVTVSLTRSSNIHFHMALYIAIEILAFVLFPFFGAISVAIVATFAAIGAYMITGEIIALIAIAAFWLTARILSTYMNEFNEREGLLRFEQEKREKEVTQLAFSKKELEKQLPVFKEKLSRYQILSDISLKLSTTFKQEDIYSFIKTSLHQIFPGKKIDIIASPSDQYSLWVNQNASSLLIENTGKDYRFSESQSDFLSLIECPILSQHHNVIASIRAVGIKESFAPGDLRVLGAVTNMAAIALEKSRLFIRTQELSITDSLTGLHTHKYFMERLDEEIKRAARYRENFALFMIDIDKFKIFNDTYGHQYGDKVLRLVAQSIRKNVRETDISGRYGGEEFSVILLNSEKETASSLAEKVRKNIENLKFNFEGDNVNVTVTIGIAAFPDNPTAESIVTAADRALYEGKRKGRNKVVFSKN